MSSKQKFIKIKVIHVNPSNLQGRLYYKVLWVTVDGGTGPLIPNVLLITEVQSVLILS